MFKPNWTPEQDDKLREMAKAGESVPAIAQALGRSSNSIRQQAISLHVNLAKTPTVLRAGLKR